VASPRAFRRRFSLGRRGATLLEAVLAIFVMSIVGLSLLSMIQKTTIVALRAREQVACGRSLQTGFARIKNLDFYALFTVDSSSANYGVSAAHPYMTVLTGFKTTLLAQKFDRYTVGVTFLRRDTTDSNSDGSITDLVAFKDANSDRIDDYDAAVRYNDQNADGDYWDTYVSGGRTVAEQPDTHIKEVALKIYKRGRLVCSQTEIVSLEQFMPSSNPSSESTLVLSLSTPANGAYLYKADTAALAASRALALFKSYPSDIQQIRADTASPLWVSGETSPLATVNVYVNSSGILDALAADAAGAVSQASPNASLALVEGADRLTGQAVKGSYSSPLAKLDVTLDRVAPTIKSMTPTGTADTLAPYVAATVADASASTTIVSGICPDVITMKIDGSTVAHAYDSSSGKVVWKTDAGGWPTVSAGAHTAYVETGDYAGYRSTQAWTFTASVAGTDHSAPAVSNKDPIGGSASSQLPVISVRVQDNQSGVVPSSIKLWVDGVLVVDDSSVGEAYDPVTGTVSYTPPSAFAAGSGHTAQIQVSHFAADPADKVTSTDSWNFTVP
jgi:hypothetical protein